MVYVIRVRCLQCTNNFTLVLKKKRTFKEGEYLGITCKMLKEHYTKACNSEEPLIFYRHQGLREGLKTDVFFEDINLSEKDTDAS